jgi:hypothetical protein
MAPQATVMPKAMTVAWVDTPPLVRPMPKIASNMPRLPISARKGMRAV